jgi:hypothetical protein
LEGTERAVALYSDGAEVAHVEGHRRAPTGPVLDQCPRRVGQRHRPSPELDELGPELDVLCFE